MIIYGEYLMFTVMSKGISMLIGLTLCMHINTCGLMINHWYLQSFVYIVVSIREIHGYNY